MCFLDKWLVHKSFIELASGTITANEIFTKLKTLFLFIHSSALYFMKEVSDTLSVLWDHFI